MINISSIVDALSDPVDLTIDFAHLWNLVPVSIEGVADTDDFISDELTVPEHDEIDRLDWSVDLIVQGLVDEVVGEHKGLTLRHPEDEPLQSLDIDRVDDTSDLVEVTGAGRRCLCEQLLLLAALNIAADLLESLLDVWKHLLGSLHDLEAVHQIRHCCLRLLELSTLVLDEGLLLGNLSLDLFEEEVERLLLLGTDVLELVQEAINVSGRVYLNTVLFALLMQKVQQSLRVFARLDLRCVRQVVRRLFSVQINEVSQANVPELAHDALRVILGHRELVQIHRLRPKKRHLTSNLQI